MIIDISNKSLRALDEKLYYKLSMVFLKSPAIAYRGTADLIACAFLYTKDNIPIHKLITYVAQLRGNSYETIQLNIRRCIKIIYHNSHDLYKLITGTTGLINTRSFLIALLDFINHYELVFIEGIGKYVRLYKPIDESNPKSGFAVLEKDYK